MLLLHSHDSLSFFPLFGQMDILPGPYMEGSLIWETAVRWMESALPPLRLAVMLVVYYWVAVLLPMSIFRRMHPLIASSLRLSTLFIGLVCWWQAFIVTYRMMGWLATSIGLLCVGVGVVPIGIFATATNGDRAAFANILTAAFLTVAGRVIARFLAHPTTTIKLSIRQKQYYADDY